METEFGVFSFVGQPLFLLETVAKSTAILIVAFLVTRMMRRSSAAVRHNVWYVAMIALLALPVVSSYMPKWSLEAAHHSEPLRVSSQSPALETPSLETQPSKSDVPVAKPGQSSIAESSSAGAVVSRPTMGSQSFLRSTVVLLSVIWSAGVLVLLTRLAIIRFRLRMVSKTAQPITEGRLFELLDDCRRQLGCRSSVKLFVANDNTMPLTWGEISPSILLPGDAASWSENQIRCALLHELAHILRHDCRTQLLVQVACAIHWLNPLVWFAARSLHVERELASDDIVLQNGALASDYAEQLMLAVSKFQFHRSAHYAAVSMASPSGFAQRLKAILSENRNRLPAGRKTTLSLAVIFIGLTSFLGAFEVISSAATAPQQPEQQQSQPAPEQGHFRSSRYESIPLEPPKESPPDAKFKNGIRPAQAPENRDRTTRSLNIVFAHDPGIGKYDGVVGGPSDIWNFVDLGTTAVDFTRFSDATSSTARLRVTRHDGEWGITGQTGIFHGYIYHNCRCLDLETKVLDLAAGKYQVYVYAHGDAPNQNAEIEIKAGKRSLGRKATASDGTWDFRTEPLREGLQYVRFDVELKAGEELVIVSHRAASDYSMFNAIQIVPTTGPDKQKPVATTPQLE